MRFSSPFHGRHCRRGRPCPDGSAFFRERSSSARRGRAATGESLRGATAGLAWPSLPPWYLKYIILISRPGAMRMYSTVSVLLFKFSTRADDVEAQFIRGFDERKPRKDQSPAGSVFSSLGNLQPDAAVAPVVSMKRLLAAAFIRRKERGEG